MAEPESGGGITSVSLIWGESPRWLGRMQLIDDDWLMGFVAGYNGGALDATRKLLDAERGRRQEEIQRTDAARSDLSEALDRYDAARREAEELRGYKEDAIRFQPLAAQAERLSERHEALRAVVREKVTQHQERGEHGQLAWVEHTCVIPGHWLEEDGCILCQALATDEPESGTGKRQPGRHDTPARDIGEVAEAAQIADGEDWQRFCLNCLRGFNGNECPNKCSDHPTDEPEAPALGGGECPLCRGLGELYARTGDGNERAMQPCPDCQPARPVEDELREIAGKIPEGEWPAGGGELVTAEVLSRCEDHRAAPEANCPNCQPAPAEEKPVTAYCGECRGHFLPPHEHEEAKSDGSM